MQLRAAPCRAQVWCLAGPGTVHRGPSASSSTKVLLWQGVNLLPLLLFQTFAMFFAFCLYYNFD